MEKLAVTVREAAELTGIGINRLYELVNAGEIPTVAVGARKKVIPVRALEEYLARQEDYEGAEV